MLCVLTMMRNFVYASPRYTGFSSVRHRPCVEQCVGCGCAVFTTCSSQRTIPYIVFYPVLIVVHCTCCEMSADFTPTPDAQQHRRLTLLLFSPTWLLMLNMTSLIDDIWGQACPGLVTIFFFSKAVQGLPAGRKPRRHAVKETSKAARPPFANRVPCPHPSDSHLFPLDSRYGTPDLRSGRQRVGQRSIRATQR